jgi:hypothetical protein
MNAIKTAASSALVAPEQLILIDGYTITKARLAVAGSALLYLADDEHRALAEDAKLGAPCEITITVAGHQLRCLGYLKASGGQVTGKEGAIRILTVKLESTLGSDGEPVDGDLGDDE